MSGLSAPAAHHPAGGREGIIGWFAHNPVAANLLMLFLIVMGLYGAYNIKLELLPEIELDAVNVQVRYLGAAPTEVEEGVVVKIEEAIQDVQGIKEIFSYAYEGLGQVQVAVADGYEPAQVLDEVKLAVDSIFTFPAETERPIISQVRVRRPTIAVQVAGDLDEHGMKELADRLRDEILALDEVSYAQVQGTRPFEISVQVPESTLRQYGLTLEQVAQAIRRWSVNLPGGRIRSDGGDIRLRTQGQAYLGEEFAQILLIARPDGARVRLGDIATIEDGFEEVESYAYFNGRPSFGIRVLSSSMDNELEVAAAVKAYVEEVRPSLPPEVELKVWSDASRSLQQRMRMMFENLVIGALLVLVILGLFLRVKFALWVILGLLVAFLGALMLLSAPGIDVSINLLSTFAFILVLGIVVDDAIVVAESVHTHTQAQGYNLANVVAGVRRVAVPAIFGVLTTIMAFLPMLFATGPVAALMGAVAWVVVLCLAFSLVESKLILPAHLGAMRSAGGAGRRPGLSGRVDAWVKGLVAQRYKPLLDKAIRNRYLTLALFVALLLLAVGFVVGGKVRYLFFPEVEGNLLSASFELHEGAPQARSREVVAHIDAALNRVNAQVKARTGTDADIIEHHFAFVDRGVQGFFFVQLTPEDERPVTQKEVEHLWREAVGELPDVKRLALESGFATGGGPPISFKLAGRDYGQLERAAAELEQHLNGFAGVYEVQVSANVGPDEVRLAIRPEAEALGLTLADLGRQVRAAFYGVEAQRIQRGDDEVKVMVRYPLADRLSLGNLDDMWVRTPDGRELPFSAVAEYQLEQGYDSIQRVDGRRAVTVTAQARLAVVEPAEVMRSVRQDYLPGLRARYPGLDTEASGSALEEEIALQQILLVFGIALFGIYALMAIPLKSYVQPLIIMSVIPFGVVGAVFGHWLLDVALSSVSMLGIVALSGVVVNDSLIMVDFVNKSKAQGLDAVQAAIQSGAARFRAILLTSLTTFFGLIPMVLETSVQAQIVIPMAVSVAFGILFATLITLILVPSLYVIAADAKRGLRRLAGSWRRTPA